MKEISYVRNGERWFTYEQVNHLPLGIVGGISVFVVSIFLWKVVCEVLYLVVRCMESYLERHYEKAEEE